MEIHALKEQGWTISAIARHTNHDRKTIRAYLAGERQPGVRVQARPDPFERFVDYVTERLREDPHLWAQTLLDELRPLGFKGSYSTLTRQIRAFCVRDSVRASRESPHCRGEWSKKTQTLCSAEASRAGMPTHEVHPATRHPGTFLSPLARQRLDQPAKGPWSAWTDRYRHVMTCDSASLGGGPNPHRPLLQLNAELPRSCYDSHHPFPGVRTFHHSWAIHVTVRSPAV